MTYFMYVDEIQEFLKQVVKDPALQSLYLTMWFQEHGLFGSDGNVDPFNLQDQGMTEGLVQQEPKLMIDLCQLTSKLPFICLD